ncbi:hypothetical protein DFP72DRAFT_883791 [Ephemerocybe angulata]|uniref:IPT/TIG domain-containing protein n=1 Tax=Ephemerocybe angulata TaxID=980116 RepID=A0A8H6MBZ4_9AGAR|nr:hypothetical protein DFP72DRAFT_883791 [Tulosesus angulatus]
MSSSSTAIADSRSPSPLTPEASDNQESVIIQSDFDNASSWYQSMYAKSGHMQWAPPPTSYHSPHKTDDNMMLRLDELIEQDAYDDSPSPSFASSSGIPSPLAQNREPSLNVSTSSPLLQNFRGNTLNASHNGPISLTKPIPPPASLPRKHDPSTLNQRVVYPPKDSCYNLPIMFPSIPEGGTKSRVETQIRVTVDLADPSSSTDPFKYDRVGAWKWLRLPQGSATKKRTRKQGKIDPDADEVLQLSVSVTCASPPHNRVLSCSSCQAREAKRVAKKLAARVRPARSDSDSGDGDGSKPGRKHHEDTTNIIQFNCAEILDFSTGSVVLPLRITCYCRHHREKVGFNVHFTMMDRTGRLIGSGMTKPIMITDDHKTTSANRNAELVASFPGLPGAEWATHPQPVTPVETRAPSRRKKESSSTSGSISNSSLPTRSPTPSLAHGTQNYAPQDVSSYTPPPPLQHSTQSSESSSPDTLATPLDHGSDAFLLGVQPPMHQSQLQTDLMSMSQHAQSSLQVSIPMNPSMAIPPQAHSMPFMLFDPNQQASQSLQLQLPTIHRLIPNNGPMHGGIEVTILGANFHPSRWSENTLVCVLPPRATPGVVAVWFEGFPKIDDPMTSPASLFTYSDESDRALMELALQVVGLKMTGKIEDAKNVAMRIVGNAGSDGSGSQGDNPNMMQLASSTIPSTRDLRSLLLLHPTEKTSLERPTPPIVPVSQALSYPSPVGQTLLHLSTFLGFSTLVQFLIDHGIDIDARDRNGYTALHFASLVKSADCAQLLLNAGADREIVNSLGKTPQEIAPVGFFDELRALRRSLPPTRKATPRSSVDVSRAATPPPSIPPTPAIPSDPARRNAGEDKRVLDAKQTASFMEKMIQRTLAQLPAPQLPGLPGMVPWAALPQMPQIPMVFPVIVPMMPNWPSFLGGENASDDNKQIGQEDSHPGLSTAAMRAAQEWRSTWEKWVAMGIATTARQQQQAEEAPPPVYTAKPTDGQETSVASTSAVDLSAKDSVASRRPSVVAEIRPVGYDNRATLPPQEVEAKGLKKGKILIFSYFQTDRMLLWFWLPILLLSAIWALHNGWRLVYQTVHFVAPANPAVVHG